MHDRIVVASVELIFYFFFSYGQSKLDIIQIKNI